MTTTGENERQEIEELLPWHAAGTLSREAAQRVDAALARDTELARRYALVREELVETAALNEALDVPTARITEQLFAKIEAEPARPAAGRGARIGDFLASLTPRTLAWAAAAAVILILLQAGFIASLVSKNSGQYQTAAVPSIAHGEGSFALIRFQPQASAADVSKFLQDNKLSLVDGPRAGGLYRMRVAPARLPPDQLDALIKKLQGDSIVAFIGAAN